MWAGNVELQAASVALKANICIYQAGQPCWTIRNFEEVGWRGGGRTCHGMVWEGLPKPSSRVYQAGQPCWTIPNFIDEAELGRAAAVAAAGGLFVVARPNKAGQSCK